MKPFEAAFALAAALWLATPLAAAAAEAKQDFSLINETGYDIKSVYVSSHRTDKWEEDVLGDDQLDDGAKVNIHFSPKTKTCKFDLKVVYEIDDSSAVWKNIDLCTVSKITIRYNKKNDKTSAEFD